tara:strand:+ start:131 stop:484 length:354 start_codon:yes stop_codon:yes gene_type:complete
MAYIGRDPNSDIIKTSVIHRYTATANQTAFTGADVNNNALDISPSGRIHVYLNGVRLDTSDFTQTTNTVTLAAGATVNDEVVIVTEGEYINANHYTKTEADASADSNSLMNALIFGG